MTRHPEPHKTFAESSSAGLHKLSPRDLPALRRAADELKQAVFTVDLQHARNVPGFIKALKRDLNFPDWFGGNLDALHDCLTDFSWHPAPGYVILLSGSQALSSHPTSFAAFNEVLASAVDEWQQRNIPFRIFYLLDEKAAGAA
jgi:RNAse (barnase) inhibitor barstar